LKLSGLPGLGIKFSKPFEVKFKRVSYVTGDNPGRYYQKVYGQNQPVKDENGHSAMPHNIKVIELTKGFSYDFEFSGPESLDLKALKGLPLKEIGKAKSFIEDAVSGSGNGTGGNSGNGSGSNAGSSPSPAADSDGDGKKYEYKNGVLWLNLKKEIGPLYIGRVGLSYKNGKIGASFDASVTFSAFSLSVIGLKIETYLSPSKMFSEWPTISIDGLAFSLKAGSIEIGGLLVRMEVQRFEADGKTPLLKANKAGKQVPVIDNEYVGELLIKLPAFTIVGMGIYGQIGGSTSVFVYGFLGMTLGGPPFFLVEGLALGFGYNRACRVPLNKISEFPLTKQALNPEIPNNVEGVKKMAKMLVKYLPAQKGTMILMLGIKFSTFKIINSFALVVITISEKPRLDVLGLSQLKLGTDPDNPIVFIELAIKASIIPDEGIVEVLGLISPSSYILSKDCKVSGGFAFKAWFSGEHAGDFVITLGGYHPKFKKPDYYPTVPRIALNWKVSDALQMKAQAYFALTPSACMAGGRLEMHFNKGPLTADFIVGADFLISWKPFFYDINVYISIKIVFKIHIDSKWWHPSININFSLDAGASLHIWGPDFSGEGQVHFHVKFFGIKFGFTAHIEFGAANSSTPPKLNWDEFKDAFLPKGKTANNEILGISCKSGLIKQEKATLNNQEIDVWILNMKEISFVVETPIPITSYQDDPGIDGKEDISILKSWKAMNNTSRSLTITPMGGKPYRSAFSIAIKRVTYRNGQLVYSSVSDRNVFLIKRSLTKNMPASLWGGGVKGKYGNLIKNLTTGFEIVYAGAPKAGATSIVPAKNFMFSDFVNNKTIDYSDDHDDSDGLNMDNLRTLIGKDGDDSFIALDTKMVSYKEFITTPNQAPNMINITDDQDVVHLEI